MTRLRDALGNTVEPAVIDGVPCFIVRTRDGYLPYPLGLAPAAPLTTPAHLAAAGVDLATLVPT